MGTDSEAVTIEHLLSNDSGREWSFGLDYVELPRAADRTQFAIDDRQFIDSMIPHHSGAILMCREADLEDAELLRLCGEIIEAQRREIELMEAIGERL